MSISTERTIWGGDLIFAGSPSLHLALRARGLENVHEKGRKSSKVNAAPNVERTKIYVLSTVDSSPQKTYFSGLPPNGNEGWRGILKQWEDNRSKTVFVRTYFSSKSFFCNWSISGFHAPTDL